MRLATEYVTGETMDSNTKASMFCPKWKIPLKKNSSGRFVGLCAGVEGNGVSRMGEERMGRPSVQSQRGNVRRKARAEQ